MYSSYQFLVKVEATSTGNLIDSLSRNDAVAELGSDKIQFGSPLSKLPTPPGFKCQRFRITCAMFLMDERPSGGIN
jgi:hypothetical protein